MPLGHGHGHRRMSLKSAHSGDETRSDSVGGDETVVEGEEGNVLSHIISQLKPGADLSKVVLPTFILEPRSMLERITNFMAHPENLLSIPEIDDPVQRFIAVVKFYLSGWHIRPPGVKKPLNPILGETFTCYWDYPDHTRGYYISEQTSHHPPKSSYFYMAPEHNIRIDGALKPRSKFLGNSAASMMEGVGVLRLMNRGNREGGERYFCTQPNMYARGILFGKMKYELGDHSYVRCPETGLVADVEFKTKGYFGGTYNAIGGVVRNENTGETLYELSGMWSGEMVAKNVTTGQKEVLFDANNAKHSPPQVRPLEEQDERESQRLWHSTAVAVKDRNHVLATDEKTKIEDRQREETAKRAEQGQEWQPKLFRKVRGGSGGPEEGEEDLDWILNAQIDGPTPEAKVKQILAIAPILPGQTSSQGHPPQQSNGLTPQRSGASSHAPSQHQQPQTTSDLIDFGQASGPSKVLPQQQHSSNQNLIQSQHMPQGLQEPMEPDMGTPLKRQDTLTKEVDEFVDAEP